MLLTAGLTIADVIGAGILAVPTVFKLFGWLPGLGVLVVMLAMNTQLSMLLWKLKQAFPDSNTYWGIWREVFDSWLSIRDASTLAFGASNYIFIFSMMGLYTLGCGKALGMLLHDVPLCLPHWTLLSLFFVMLIHINGQKLGSWPSLIWVNLGTTVGTVIIPIAYMMWQGTETSRPQSSQVHAVADMSLSDAFLGISCMFFSLPGQFMLIEIMGEMQDTSEFPRAYLGFSVPFQLLAFSFVGLGGYYYRGDALTGIIVDFIPFNLWFRIAAACLLSHMMLVYIVKSTVVCRAVHRKISPDTADGESETGRLVWSSTVVGVMLAAICISQTIPFFTDLVELLGAIAAPWTCWIVPILLYVVHMYNSGRLSEISKLEWLMFAIELTLAVVVSFGGTYMSILSIREHWKTYGPPFGCHCEDMWSTCGCSATHAGMEQCPLKQPLL